MIHIACPNIDATKNVAAVVGRSVRGGEVIAFSGDVGGGKTTFVKGLAEGMGVHNVVQSPTFTISFIHKASHGLELHHFDFYRLSEPGIMRAELAESLVQSNAVVVIEWGDIVHDILPKDTIIVSIAVQNNDSRVFSFTIPKKYDALQNALSVYTEQRKLA